MLRRKELKLVLFGCEVNPKIISELLFLGFSPPGWGIGGGGRVEHPRILQIDCNNALILQRLLDLIFS